MSYEPPLDDPWTDDDSDYIECKECKEWFDHNLYNSFTCERCEDLENGATE